LSQGSNLQTSWKLVSRYLSGCFCGAIYISTLSDGKSRKEREQVLLAEAQAHEAQIRALRYQLNPHFLFNSMNAVSTLVAEGVDGGYLTDILAHAMRQQLPNARNIPLTLKTTASDLKPQMN
jgi:LytS/YehU family sensor histidine kinase